MVSSHEVNQCFRDFGKLTELLREGCFVTNLDLPAQLIWTSYHKRANAENRIKQLKYDFGSDNFNMQSFYATEAALNIDDGKQFRKPVQAVGAEAKTGAKTLRYDVFAIVGPIVKNGNQRILKLALAMKRREWFTALWMNTHSFSSPAIF